MKKKVTFLMAALFATFASVNAQDQLPPNAVPGKCYVKCVQPDQYETTEERVMVKPAYSTLRVVPAEYKVVEETVIVKEATKRYEFVPAEYKTEYVPYVEEQGYNKLAVNPASFTSSSVSIETFPKVMRWESQAYEGCESDNPADCQVFCWREYDAQVTTIGTQKLASDATTSANAIAAKNGQYAKQVIVRPAEVREIDVPAVTKVIKKRVLVKDETTVVDNVDAVYQTVTKQVLKTKGGVTTWQEIECELLDYNVLPINYPTGSAALTSTARKIIRERLLKMMQENPGTKVEISSHTDSRGSASSNQSLSERRAQSVVNYLVSNGISANRLVAKGYGENRLKNKCADGVSCTDAEHAANRRTEFRVLNF